MRRSSRAHVLGVDEFMARAREWPAARAAEACGVPEAQIHTLVAWLAEADPLVLAPGNGLERGRNGGSGIRAGDRACRRCWASWATAAASCSAPAARFPKTMARLQRPDLAPPGTRTLNLIDFGRHLERDDIDPPLRAVFIYNHNPIVVHPDQNRMRRGLAREDVFTVGIDVTMTESMAHCDIVLPAASSFECDDLYASYGHHWLQRAEPVIAPLGESLPNTEIFRRLAARFGFDDACFKASDAELMDEAVDRGRSAPRRRAAEPRFPRRAARHDGGGRRADGVVRECVSGHAVRQGGVGVGLAGEPLGRGGADRRLARARGGVAAEADFAGVGQADFVDARRAGGVAACRRSC